MPSFKKYLNPIVRDLHVINDFSKVRVDNVEISNEYPYLRSTINVISQNIANLIEKLESLEIELEKQILIVDRETGDDKKDAIKVYNNILKMIEDIVQRINHESDILDSPYFGKIVFDRKKNDKFPKGKIRSYIGKFAYFDRRTKQSLITDWRAPIANIYYTNSGPARNISFKSPLGLQEGNLEEKKMLEISKAQIKNVYNSTTGNTAADEFLLSQLSQKIGQKLTDIVSTIQNEQNAIIRDEVDKFVILQGVAGSGKTTIVLHRLAYLFFTYKESINPNKTLIIAPNKLFLDYISGVLPSLGIDGVETNTYLFWAKKTLGWGSRYLLSNEDMDINSQKVKGSHSFLVKLVEGLDRYIDDLLLNLPYSSSDSVYSNYYQILARSPDISRFEAINLALKKVESDKMFKSKTVGTFVSLTVDTNDLIHKKLSSYLKTHLDTTTIYKGIVNEMSIEDSIKKRTGRIVRKKGKNYYYEAEDIAPITIIHMLLHGTSEIQRDYVIVDEAQDFSFSQIFSLLLISRRNNLMLAGDLAQAIKTPTNIEDWVEIFDMARKLKDKDMALEFHQLNKCYRTTVEIIEYVTSKVDALFPNNLLRPEAVLRHGEKVVEIDTKESILSEGSSISQLQKVINSEIKTGRNTVAIITPTKEQANGLYIRLKNDPEISHYLVDFGTDNYKSGVIVVPLLEAKGLEFDSVIIIDVSKNNYEYHFDSARKFYVAATRALHSLYVFYPKNNMSEILGGE